MMEKTYPCATQGITQVYGKHGMQDAVSQGGHTNARKTVEHYIGAEAIADSLNRNPK